MGRGVVRRPARARARALAGSAPLGRAARCHCGGGVADRAWLLHHQCSADGLPYLPRPRVANRLRRRRVGRQTCRAGPHEALRYALVGRWRPSPVDPLRLPRQQPPIASPHGNAQCRLKTQQSSVRPVSMSTLFTTEPRRSMPFITGGTMERMFADGPESLCPARLAFHKADQRPPADYGWAMVRGILAGAVVESELVRWANRRGFSVD